MRRFILIKLKPGRVIIPSAVTIFSIFTFLAFNLSAQEISFNKLGISEGLSQRSALCFAQDRQGFIWIGTGSGLNRYDSKTFKIYKNENKNSSSVSGDYICSILADSKNNLWVGTLNGLNKYDPRTDNFIRYESVKNKVGSLSNNYVRCIYEDKKGMIWIGTASGLNLLEHRGTVDEFRRVTEKSREVDLGMEDIHAIKEDWKGNLWVSSNNHITRISMSFGKMLLKSFPTDPAAISVGHSTVITAIEEDEYHKLWFGTKESGLFSFDQSTETIKPIANTGLSEHKLIHDFIRKLKSDHKGHLWIATQEGLVSMDVKNHLLTTYQNEPENKKSISQNSIYDLFFDRDHNFWIGTYFGGINVVYSRNTPFHVIQSKGEKKNVLSNNVISSIVEYRPNSLLIGTEGGGLNLLDRSSGKITYLKAGGPERSGLLSNLIKVIFKDREGLIWVGTHDGGLSVFRPDLRLSRQFVKKNIKTDQLGSNSILSLMEDHSGLIWIGTEDSGLNVYDKKTDHFEHYYQDTTGSKKLNASIIRSIVEDEAQTIWVASEKGLFIKGLGKDKFEQYTHLFGNGKSIPHNLDITCLFQDSRKQIWVGTMSDGLYKINPVDDQLVHYATNDGLPNRKVKGIIEDDSGSLWITTDDGLCKLSNESKSFDSYDISDGLPGNEFNFNAVYKDELGDIFLGELEGLLFFTPSKIEKNNFRDNIVFTSLKLGNNDIGPSVNRHILNRSISYSDSISLEYGQNIFTLEFSLLNFIKPEKNRYAYKLAGFEKEWNNSASGIATYTNLSPGKYKLFVKASNNDGNWGNRQANLTIIIKPPYWATWWAFTLYIVFTLLVILLIFRFFWLRSRFMHEQELQQYKLDFFTNVSHEIRTHLTMISGPLELLDENTLIASSLSKQIGQIKKHALKLSTLVSEILDFRKAETGNLPLNYAKENLTSFLEDIVNLFLDAASKKQISLVFDHDNEEISVHIDKVQFEKVITNLITNSLKFTGTNGKIILTVEKNNKNASISISDNGVGISPKYFKKLFNNYFQINNYQLENTGYGIGLALSKSITELHGGSIEVQSIEQKNGNDGNTTFKITLPLYDHIVETNRDNLDKSITTSTGRPSFFVDSHEHPAQGKPLLLIVEDNEELRSFISDALSFKFMVYESENGVAGLECAISIIPDIIISDVMMPEMDGIELCRRIKSDEKTNHIPIILLTAKATINDQLTGFESHADAYITKPFNVKLLETQVINLIENRKLLQEKFKSGYFSYLSDVVSNEVEDSFMKAFIDLIEANLDNSELNVTLIAQQMAMSTPVLYRKLKAISGMSVNEFVKSVRLKRAAALIKTKKYNINEISYKVGFTDRKYFSKEFKKMYGKNPTEFK